MCSSSSRARRCGQRCAPQRWPAGRWRRCDRFSPAQWQCSARATLRPTRRVASPTSSTWCSAVAHMKRTCAEPDWARGKGSRTQSRVAAVEARRALGWLRLLHLFLWHAPGLRVGRLLKRLGWLGVRHRLPPERDARTRARTARSIRRGDRGRGGQRIMGAVARRGRPHGGTTQDCIE